MKFGLLSAGSNRSLRDLFNLWQADFCGTSFGTAGNKYVREVCKLMSLCHDRASSIQIPG